MQFVLKVEINAPAKLIYETWLDSKGHSMMTGGDAQISDSEGDSFSAWDGYIFGKNIELKKNQLIKQTWRTTEFNEAEKDSILEIKLIQKEESTELIIAHKDLPKSGIKYKKGWIDHYIEPMREYFSQKN